jgi:hypothetical protein
MFLIGLGVDKALFNSRALDMASSLCAGSCSALLCFFAFAIVLLLYLYLETRIEDAEWGMRNRKSKKERQ